MSIMQTAKKEGMTILNQELARLVTADAVDPEEAWRKAVDKGDLVKQIESSGSNHSVTRGNGIGRSGARPVVARHALPLRALTHHH